MDLQKGLKVLGLTVVLASFAAGLAAAQNYPEMKLKFGHFAPPTAAHAKVDQWFADQLKKRSGGKITEQIFWAGAAGKAPELLGLVGQGGLDIATVPASYFPAKLPLLAAPSAIPLALPSPEKAQEIVDALWKNTPAMQAEAKAANVWPLFFHPLNRYHLLCRKPVRTLADLKGLRIRSQGEFIPLALNAVGAVPVTVLPSEFYESLQRHSVDCMLLPWDLMTAFRLQEVAKYGSTINFGSLVSDPQWFNLNRWNSFSPAVKKLFNDIAKDAHKKDLEEAAASEKAALAKMKAAGVQIVTFTEQKQFEAKMPPFLDIWAKKMEKIGQGDAAKKMVALWKSLR